MDDAAYVISMLTIPTSSFTRNGEDNFTEGSSEGHV